LVVVGLGYRSPDTTTVPSYPISYIKVQPTLSNVPIADRGLGNTTYYMQNIHWSSVVYNLCPWGLILECI